MYEPLATTTTTLRGQQQPSPQQQQKSDNNKQQQIDNNKMFRQLQDSPHHHHHLRHKHMTSYASLPHHHGNHGNHHHEQQNAELLFGYADVGSAKTVQHQNVPQHRGGHQLLRPRPIYPTVVHGPHHQLSRATSYASSVDDLISSSGIGDVSSTTSSSSRRGSNSSDPRSMTSSKTSSQRCSLCGNCNFHMEQGGGGGGAFMLPCQHCLCRKCVDHMLLMTSCSDVIAVLDCPVCREPFSLDTRKSSDQPNTATIESDKRGSTTSSGGTLSSNDANLDGTNKSSGNETLISSRNPEEQPESKQQQSCQYCEGELPLVATHYCNTCDVYYCDVCLRTTHPRKKPFTNHQIRDVNEVITSSERHSDASQQQPPSQDVAIVCSYHTQKLAEVYCSNCDKLLCKGCGLSEDHDDHYMCNLHEWSRAKKIGLECDVTRMGKQTGELKRVMETLQESYRQIEVSSEHQENKISSECESLIRIIRDRCDVITAKIKDNKVVKLRHLSQQIAYVREAMEVMTSAVVNAKQCCNKLMTSSSTSSLGGSGVVNDDNDVIKIENLSLFNNDSKIASERLTDAMNMAKQVICNCNYDVTNTYQSSNQFTLDFSKERSILEKLNILEPPSLPRICDELCTQSHDKVTLQWRSQDHQGGNVDRYELQYAIDDQIHSSHQHHVKSDNWMIVPNIKTSHYTLHGLQSGTKYIFAVRSINKAGSNLSDIIPIKTLGIPFHFDVHSIHKKLRILNHNYTVVRDENEKIKTKHDTSLYGVTGDVNIDSGRHYWEVVVCQSTIYSLGVAHADVARYDWVGKNNKSWVLCRNNQTWSAKHDGKETILMVPFPFPKKIGILLNFDNGKLIFFDGASGCQIHSFHPGAFRKALRPSFALNNKSLTINTGIVVPDHLQL